MVYTHQETDVSTQGEAQLGVYLTKTLPAAAAASRWHSETAGCGSWKAVVGLYVQCEDTL